MKRLSAILCVLLAATSAFAFNPEPAPVRIAVLRGHHDAQIAMASALRTELRTRGFDAFDAEQSYEDVTFDEERAVIADYYVEVVYADPRTEDYGGIGIGSRNADIELGVVVSKLQAELRVYDGETMELLASENLSKRKTSILPTAVGVGGRALYAVIAMPFIERAQHRSVARAAARDAASIVVDVVRGE